MIRDRETMFMKSEQGFGQDQRDRAMARFQRISSQEVETDDIWQAKDQISFLIG